MSKLRFIFSALLLTSCSSASTLLVAESDGSLRNAKPAIFSFKGPQPLSGSPSIATCVSGNFAIFGERLSSENVDDPRAPNNIVAMLPTPEPATWQLLALASTVLFSVRSRLFR